MVDSKENQTINISISEILNNALSSDKTTRQDSENKLSNLALRNFPEFLFNLATELADESKPIKSRQMAATYIKNSIFISNDLKDIWVNKIDPTAKEQIKNLILSTLATKFKEVRAAAGLVLAGICRVDLPLNEKWPTLIASLCQSAYHENLNIRLAAIESLGYICEELTPKTIDSGSVDTILSALIQNINQSIKDAEIVRASLKAFFHTIKLAEKNFSRGVLIYLFLG
jgi:importin subunit beta-1